MKLFALRHIETKDFMGFYTTSNEGEFCVSVEYELTQMGFSDCIWLTKDRKIAEYVCNNDTEWFNAGYDSPKNSYVGKLEVVELELKEI